MAWSGMEHSNVLPVDFRQFYLPLTLANHTRFLDAVFLTSIYDPNERLMEEHLSYCGCFPRSFFS